jgi:hypothetical protein
MTTAPEVEEETELTAEEIDEQLDQKLIDAEVFLRHVWDLLDDLAEGKRIPRAMVDQIAKLAEAFDSLHDELVDAMPED